MRHDTRGHGSQLEIESSASYIFASHGLEIDLGAEEPEKVSRVDRSLTAYVELGSSSLDSPLISIEETSEGMTLCLDASGQRPQFARALLSGSTVSILMLGEQFNARIFKLEFERAYLSLLR
jgi:hypothetical protein